ncbi:MAG: VWA domain-containing protein [Planctomycetota bacterium]
MNALALHVPITFASPKFLLLLLAIPLAVWIGRRTLAGLDPFRRRAAMTLRLAGIALLALALSELQWKDVLDEMQVVFVVDQSKSIPDTQTQAALDVVNAACATMDPRKDRAKLVVFGKDAFSEATLEKDKKIAHTASDIERDHTNLENAIKVALDAFDPNVRRRLVLVSDGNETIGDVLKGAIPLAKARKARVDVVPLEYAYSSDLLVDKVVLPTEAKLGEPFKVSVVVNSAKAVEAKVDLFQDGELIESRRVELHAGTNIEVFDLILKKPNFYRINARVQAIDSSEDKLHQNNEGNGFVFVKGESTVLYVHRNDDEDAISRPLIEALRRERIALTIMPAASFPQSALALQTYDAVILDDVPRDSFSDAQMKAVETAVHDEGIGLCMIGGEHAFGAGDWRKTPVEEALPVDMDIKQETVVPNGALVLVMHSCEFPDGNRWGIKICQESIGTLSAKDQVGLIQYGNMGGVEWVFKLQPAANKERLKALAGTMSPGDMPDFDAVFVTALDSLKPANAAVKHMILLSDGDPSPPRPEIIAAYKAARITCSTVIICPHGGKNGGEHMFMQRLANELGGKCYYVDEPKDLPKIFQRETQRVARSLIVNADFVPARGQRTEILKGIDKMPSLKGYVLTEPKPRAEVTLLSHQGAPIFAQWHHGAGKSIAFTSDATNRWGSNWVNWNQFANFWGQAIRWVSKDVQETPFQISTRVQGEVAKITLDAVDNQGKFMDGLTVDASVRSPKDEKTRKALKQVGPGRYEVELPAKDVGAYTVSLLTKDKEGKRRHSATTGMVVPYSEEFKKLQTDRVLLAAIARAGDGQVIEPKTVLAGPSGKWKGFFARDDKSELDTALRDKWALVLAICAFCFLADVAIRRVAIDWDKIFAKVRATFARGPRREAERIATMDRLMQRKQEVQKSASERLDSPTHRGAESTHRGAEPEKIERPKLAKFEASSTASSAAGPVVAGSKEPIKPGEPKLGAKPADKPKDPQQGAFTNRLLEAKKRALRGMDDNKDKKDEETK